MPDRRRTSSLHLGYPTAEDDDDNRRTRTMRGSQHQDDDGDNNATYSTSTTTAQQHHHENVVRTVSSQQQQQQQGGGVEEYYGYNNTTTPSSSLSLLSDQEIYNETIRIESEVRRRRESQIQEQEDAMLATRLAKEEEDRLESERAARQQQELESSSQLMMGIRNERERLVHQLLQVYTSSSSLPQHTSLHVERPLPRFTDKLVRYDAPISSSSRQSDGSCCLATSSSSSTTTSTTTCCNIPRCQQQQQHKQHPHQDFTMISTTSSPDDDGSSSGGSNSQSSSPDVCAVCYEPLDTGVAVSLKMCNHIFHLDCICEALDHQKGCPTCRTDVRSTPTDGNSPTGTMFVSRPEIGSAVVDRPGSVNPTVIKIEYKIPSGIQAPYHPNPGMPYKGIGRVAFLPDTSQGNEIIHRLIYAFEHGLTFRVNDKGRVRWGSIPHIPYLGEKVDDTIRLACCTEELDRLGIPDPRSQLSRSTA